MTQNDPPLGNFPAVELSAPPVAALARTIHAVGDKWAGRGGPALPSACSFATQSLSFARSGMWVKLMRMGAASRLSCTLPK